MHIKAATTTGLAAAAAVAFTAAAVSAAGFGGNLNYDSPSRRDVHANLGVDVPRVVARGTPPPPPPQDPELLRKKRGATVVASSAAAASAVSAPASASASASAAASASASGSSSSPDLRGLRFTHGVASGDPYADSVILWTRAAPSADSDAGNAAVEGTVPLYSHDTETFVKADPHPVCVEWSVFEPGSGSGSGYDQGHGHGHGSGGNRNSNGNGNGNGNKVVAAGEAYTTSDIDYTVKVSSSCVLGEDIGRGIVCF